MKIKSLENGVHDRDGIAYNVNSMFKSIDNEINNLFNDLKNDLNFKKRWEDLKKNVHGAISSTEGFVDSIKDTFTFDGDVLLSKGAIDDVLDSSYKLTGYQPKDEFSKYVRDSIVFTLLSNYITVVQKYDYKNTEEQKEHIYKLDLLLNGSKTSGLYDVLLKLKNDLVKYLYDNVANKIYSKKVNDNILNAIFFEYGNIFNLEKILDENSIEDPFFIKDKEVKFYAS